MPVRSHHGVGRPQARHASILPNLALPAKAASGPTPVVALTATLDHPAAEVSAGTPLPPLWHWLYFLPMHRQSEIGADGHARRGGFLMVRSEAGFVSVTGTPDEPSKSGLSIADIAAGMYAYTNILAALMQRNIDGRGRRIDISMLEALGEWMSYPMYYAFDGAAHRRQPRHHLSVRTLPGW